MATPGALMIQTLPGRESTRYIAGELYDRVTGHVTKMFEKHDAWRGGNTESIEALATRAENAERQLRALLDGDEWTYPLSNQAMRASCSRVLAHNLELTGNY